MPENRFFVDTALTIGQQLQLDSKEAHHLMVMRKAVGERVELINGKNLLAEAIILSIEKKKVELRVEEIVFGKRKKREIILCQALCEPPRLDLILQKTVELGVHEIWLFGAEKSLKTEVNPHQMKRMEAIVISAMKQCGRVDLPLLHYKGSLLHFSPLEAPAFFGDVDEGAPLLYPLLREEKRIFLFIGPPSGFSNRETLFLKNVGACGVKLNDLILRTETAAICAVALAMH